MRGLQVQEHREFGGQAGVGGRGGADEELFGDRTECAESFLDFGFRSRTTTGSLSWGRVVLVEDRRGARGGERVIGGDLPCGGVGDQQSPLAGGDGDGGPDQAGRHRIAGRAEADAGELVDLAGHRWRPDLQSQRRQRPEHGLFLAQALGGDRVDLGVHPGVDLDAPGLRGGVRGGQVHRSAGQVGVGEQRDDQVALGVADEVFDDALRFGVGGVAEVGTEPVVGGHPHVVRGRDHHVRHDCAFEAGHPVGQDLGGHPADRGEGLGDQRQGGGGAFVGGEGDEPPP